jgi:hypothetical protein
MERWIPTEGGQFLRQTGRELYVTNPAYALDFLAGFCDDRMMEQLVSVNAFKDAGFPKP